MSTQQRIAVFGGTFDPPHNGHLEVAHSVIQHCAVDRLLFVVAGMPWQKLDAGIKVTSAADRLAMVQAMVEASGQAEFEVSPIEVERSEATHTVETLTELATTNPEAKLMLVIGSDLTSQLDTWHNPEQIRQLADLIVVSRPGYPAASLPAGWSGMCLYEELTTISSTRLRNLLKTSTPQVESNSLKAYIPHAVLEIITARELYNLKDNN